MRPDSRRGVVAVLVIVAVLLVGCGMDRPGPSRPPASGAASAAPSAAASGVAALDVPPPGQPYGADEILTAMRESRRPDGVPDELETTEIATAVAESVWTLGGEPWAVMAIGGSCGAQSCELEVAGAPANGAGEDLYVFAVDPDTGNVGLVQALLLGLEPQHVRALDELARDRWSGDLEGLALAAARWLPPPDDGRFVLSYRSGGEEGTPGVDLLVDLEAGTVEEMPAS